MTSAAKLAAYAVVLAAVFVVGVLLGGAVGPDVEVDRHTPPAAEHQEHDT